MTRVIQNNNEPHRQSSTTCIKRSARQHRLLKLWLLLAIASQLFLMLSASAVEPSDFLPPGDHHSLFTADMPAGTVGQGRLAQRGPVANYFQPVVFSGPAGTLFALPQQGAIAAGEENLMAGLLIGSVYRFRVTRIPEAEGAELYPTLELIDRTYPPAGLATSYPIPVTIDQADLEAALEGKLVTRVVYLEDPQTAIPLAQKSVKTRVIDVSQHQDALRVADTFGRPVAILRIGSVAPPRADVLMPQFYFGYPSWAPIYQGE